MITSYGIDPAHDAAVACNSLRRAVRELAEDDNLVGLGLAANVLDQVADALDRHWQILRPQLDAEREDEEAARERATCSVCLARTYRHEECVCDDGGDAENYDEIRAS